jgi:hypothetical protein
MKTITMNDGSVLKVKISDEMALQILRDNDYAVARSVVYWNSHREGRRWRLYHRRVNTKMLLHNMKRKERLGIYTSTRRSVAQEVLDAEVPEVEPPREWPGWTPPSLADNLRREMALMPQSDSPAARREAKFWEEHPGCDRAIFAKSLRRVNLILKKLKELEEAE